MECPHLSSSVCIAPDSAKFPNGSPSSWCCSAFKCLSGVTVLCPQRVLYVAQAGLEL
ncbi:USP3 isoform 16 [Pan troglodytes]|uniref:Ubiquitin specific peptidase 3 n=4 Tax=Hominidae TaxID=9604 RepID=H0YNK1_HUMAN|nr:ubiquitin specific peptidase 3 [Homo sapiens]PNI74469.1 USP3 isoform 8 [Pan troglodytes]PNJ29314.1 USP3 isoform 8 [Pongo abelii]KAI2574583.1 ubiquitin specific peptidase 3 [Homo sapiens]KAI4058182.1 ubiquitin specific peptidase 3 [Homo sapiens]